MKFLFSAVPQWYPVSPYLASALLVGQLKNAGYDAESYDFNIEFFNDILKKDYLEDCLSKAKAFLSDSSCLDAKDDLSNDINNKRKQTALIRKQIIEDYLADEKSKPEEIIEKAEYAVSVYKSKELFYNPEELYKAKDIVMSALDIASLPYVPSRIMLDNYIANPIFTYDFKDVDYQCKNAEVNMFLPYFEKKLRTLDLSQYTLISISITDLSQIVPGLTLARLLKKYTDAKIAIGGNYIFKIESDIKKIPTVFEEYCDFLSIGDGEKVTVELAEYFDGKRDISDVHSLIYMDENGVIHTNEKAPCLDLDAVAYPDFVSYDFSKYFSPETVIPVQLGKGCYWSKCTFCDFYTGQQKFDMKSVIRAVDEVEYLSKKYNSKLFNFVDEAVPPKFYDAFATEVKKRGLEIYYYSFARLEKTFTADVLKNLYESGARFFMWGYEAESERVMKLINKGIDLSHRQRILADARDAGLWNLCTFLLGYPTETPEELQSTIDVIYRHDLINTCTPSNFALKKNAILKDEASTVGITDFTENGELHISYKYQSLTQTMEEVKAKRNSFERKFLEDSRDRLFAHSFTESDSILLYLVKYGRDYVRDYRLTYKRKI
jgi:radical SAM superfamily enzyme YgiQ (UPF0313 family)